MIRSWKFSVILAASLLGCAAESVAAELAGIKLGSNVSTLASLGKVSQLTTEPATPQWSRHEFNLDDGRIIDVSAKGGIIKSVGLAAAPGDQLPTGVRGIVLNKTTMAEIRKILGSDGFTYDADAVIRADGLLFLNRVYRVARDSNAVIGFVTMAQGVAHDIDPASPAAEGAAVLVSVMLADAAFMDEASGKKTVSRGEKPVDLQ